MTSATLTPVIPLVDDTVLVWAYSEAHAVDQLEAAGHDAVGSPTVEPAESSEGYLPFRFAVGC